MSARLHRAIGTGGSTAAVLSVMVGRLSNNRIRRRAKTNPTGPTSDSDAIAKISAESRSTRNEMRTGTPPMPPDRGGSTLATLPPIGSESYAAAHDDTVCAMAMRAADCATSVADCDWVARVAARTAAKVPPRSAAPSARRASAATMAEPGRFSCRSLTAGARELRRPPSLRARCRDRSLSRERDSVP